jgi:NAD(P)-dependent dehydrogenase (short-subunit alcohol dehydrogenase family)
MTKILVVTPFGATSTTDEVLSGVDLKGKRILVTGVSAGLGVETARSLVAHGAQVVGAARDLNKATAATEQVRTGAAANGGSFELIELDLANLKNVRACADALLAKGQLFDVIIANAGVMATPFGHTADGFETQFGTNHLGHFVLVNRIASLIRDGGRLINLSSAAIAIRTWTSTIPTLRARLMNLSLLMADRKRRIFSSRSHSTNVIEIAACAPRLFIRGAYGPSWVVTPSPAGSKK